MNKHTHARAHTHTHMREKVDLRDNTAMPNLISEGHGNKSAQSGFGKGYLLPPSYQNVQEKS